MSDSSRSNVTLQNLETTATEPHEPRFRINDFAVLLKPKIMSLVVFTALVASSWRRVARMPKPA